MGRNRWELCPWKPACILLLLVVAVTTERAIDKIKRVKRAAVKHYGHCPGDQSVTAPPGKTCARVHWNEPSGGSSRKSGGNPGDCFRAGDHRIKYEYDGALGWHWTSGDECSFTIRVTVHYCSSNPPSIAHGSRHCTGDSERVYGSVCHYTCPEDYLLQGPSSVTCQQNSGSMQWSNTFPTACRQACSWRKNHCWPGDCSAQLADNCHCRPGFKSVDVNGARLCDLDTPPLMDTCQLYLTDMYGTDTRSGYTGNVTDCTHQRDEIINTRPVRLTFKIGAHLNLSVGNYPRYLHKSEVGVVGTRVTAVRVALNGKEHQAVTEYFNTSTACNANADALHPVVHGMPLECTTSMNLSVVSLRDGEKLCVDMESFSGGYYTLQDETTRRIRGTTEFSPVSTKKRICFLYDESKPIHCSDEGCGREPLRLSTRITRQPEIRVHVEGWKDPIPRGGNESSASHIGEYRLEVHKMLLDGPVIKMDPTALPNFTHTWKASSSPNGSYDFIVPLPEESARMYAILLEVHDLAGDKGNVAYARRFVLYDNSSTLHFDGTMVVYSANARTNFTWQTNAFQDVCVNWTGHFYNKELKSNNPLKPIKPEDAMQMTENYEQTTGLLPVNGTNSVDGVVKFEMSWRLNEGNRTSFTEVNDLQRQTMCLRSRPIKDGEMYQVWIRATDIVGNTKIASTTVHIDHTGPKVTVHGLQGRLGKHGLYVHNSTDLSAITLSVHASDPHSGLERLDLIVGTTYLSEDVAHKTKGVQRLVNVTSCSGEKFCYCPDVGPCENYNYVIAFNEIINVNNSQGLHHREYYIAIRATNNAKLATNEIIDVLVDASPPTAGVVFEGLSDDVTAEMDFTSNDVMHVRWHGFTDHESGIMLYRVVTAERCLDKGEMESASNTTKVDGGFTSTTLKLPGEGHYFTSVIAYNGAMQPSTVACSDGLTYDTTAPMLRNVSLFHSRTGRAIACTPSNQTWLINANFTKVKLPPTSACLQVCAASSSRVDVDHIILTSNFSLEDELSDDLCRRLKPMTSEHHILLPSDYLKVEWAGLDDESHMEEFYVGIATDRSLRSSPDLLSFTPTQGRQSYHARHAGLGHGARFYVFLRAVNKAGLDVMLTLGPVIVDVTPPDVTGALNAFVRDGFLVVNWNNGTFSDTEQPKGVDFDFSFRVGHEAGFVTPFLSLPESLMSQCVHQNVTGCARYPVTTLQRHDTEQGRHFVFQLHVTNAAGHVTSVNTSGVRLPAHLPPSHGVVMDVLRLRPATTTKTPMTTMKTTAATSPLTQADSTVVTATTSNLPENVTTSDVRNMTNTSQTPIRPLRNQYHLLPEFSKDIDVVLQREEICIAWSGFYHAEDVAVEIAIGSSPNQDDVVKFSSVKNRSPACQNATLLPVYIKLFSVVKASSSGGTTLFSSDGFQIVPRNDAENRIKIFNGGGCKEQEVTGKHTLNSSESSLKLNAFTANLVHPGDILFVRISPFEPNLSFSDAVLLQTTLTGYQIIAKSSNATDTFPPTLAENSSLEMFNCLMDAEIIPASRKGFDVTWEVAGPWSSLVTTKKVEIMDETCLENSVKKSKYTHELCLAASVTADSRENRATIAGDIASGHQYTARITPCFDDGCLPSVASTPVLYDSTPRTVRIMHSGITAHNSLGVGIAVTAAVEPAFGHSSLGRSQPCVAKWTVSRDRYGSTALTDWSVTTSTSCSNITIQQDVDLTDTSMGTLYVCLQLLYPLRSENPTCKTLVRPRSLNSLFSFHLVEVDHNTLEHTNLEGFLHTHQLGSKLHQLYDLDVDFISSDTVLSAILSDADQRNVTWFLMTSQRAPPHGDCVADPECVTSKTTATGTVVFSRTLSKLRDGQSYYICALVASRSTKQQGQGHGKAEGQQEVCGDGVTVDDTSPEPGNVVIRNTQSGYLGNADNVMVTWTGFTDGGFQGIQSSQAHVYGLNYSVALGSYPGAEDISHYVPVGQLTTWTFDHLDVTPGTTCYATVKAADQMGHATQSSSDPVVVDITPPTVGHVNAGTITHESYVPGPELSVHWDGVEDMESGIKTLQIAVTSEGGQSIVPFQLCHGMSSTVVTTGRLVDGHSYVLLLKATNRAGLSSMTSSQPFVIDSSPPGPGVVRNSGTNTSVQSSYSREVGMYPVSWTGFDDPHSGLAYFRVGLGSAAKGVDINPYVYVGLQNSYVWKREFDQGKKYYVTVEACNHAGLCRVTSSSSMTFDNSPPSPGHVTVGFDGRHSKFFGHITSVPVQWVGFSDPQTGIADFRWCLGKSSTTCDVIPMTQTILSRGAVTSGISLPAATPLYVIVMARNAGGLETTSVSDSFQVDPTPPEVITQLHFVSPRDGRKLFSQWDRSILRLAWKFWDPDSTVVSHSVEMRSKLTGRLVMETINLAADTELTLTLKQKNLLLDGDSHWAAVTACNAAGLCATSTSSLLLIDSSPPVAGTFLSPLIWDKVNSSTTVLHLAWRDFSDVESDVIAYDVTMGREYNGEGLSKGVARVLHDNTTEDQTSTLQISETLEPGDEVYLSIRAENQVGLHSEIVRMAYTVLADSSNKTSGTLLLIRHSCDAYYCTKECTCAPTGEHCQISSLSACQSCSPADPSFANFSVHSYIGIRGKPHTFTTSLKCLEGHWEIKDPALLKNVSRFQWSFSLFNKTEGDGVFVADEEVWFDVGRNTDVIHCLPGSRVLQSGLRYVLHVRVWLSRDKYSTFTSEPVVVDQTPPKAMKRRTVIESGVTCKKDVDYVTTEPYVTACWNGVFQDPESPITRYEVWVGTARYGSDFLAKRDMALNTSLAISTTHMEEGTRYYVSLRAWNEAGLQTTLVSDGVSIDVMPPIPGVVFSSRHHNSRHAQSSQNSLDASWHGFEDRHSGVTSYHVALYDVDDVTEPVAPFTDVGFLTQFEFKGLSLAHGHRYFVSVKARDQAGLESAAINSSHILVDTTPPSGVSCKTFYLQDQATLDFTPTSSFLHDSYTGTLTAESLRPNELMKIEVQALNLDRGANGYLQVEEMRMPIYFKYTQSGDASAEHVFISPAVQNSTLTATVVAEGNSGASITAKFYRCNNTVETLTSAVTIQQLSSDVISVCARVMDKESGIRGMMIGVGTTEGGVQISPFTHVGHSGHAHFTVHVQHATLLYASVIAENHASQWSRFISRPVVMDRTGPLMSGVKVKVRYENEGQVNATLAVWVDAEWTAKDEESGVESCSCQLKGHTTSGPRLQLIDDVTRGTCQWLLKEPRHGAAVSVVITCVNRVQIHTSVTSETVVVLLEPPDLSHLSIVPLANSPMMSPFEQTDPYIQSSNASLQFHWRGLDDPTVAAVRYRFLQKQLPLADWRPLPVSKTSAVLDKGPSERLPEGEVTLQVQAQNHRHMMSDIKSQTIVVTHSKPTLTGNTASITITDDKLKLDWHNVFNNLRDVTFSVFAGTSEGYGDVINHMTTKSKSTTVYFFKKVSDLYVTIWATERNGVYGVYTGELMV
ncbi:uncharacterized protein [Littorina saxatilis]|uniref:Uncharacterized protein n=1 Tax=Littorina saxatilis TaxID=31220 RepID=A0AAN9ASX7_9CAEN